MFPQAPASIYQTQKCFVTYGTMGHIDPKQLPQKGGIWSPIMAQDYIHRVDLIVPSERYETIHQKLTKERSAPEYYKVNMTLGDILGGDFFTEYIKKGNVLMLSEGKTTVGNMFNLREGNLDMYLDKETYERAGLPGKPYGSKGGRGLKPRWIVSYNLRNPSMLHGKKGFDRLVYACKNVLNQPFTWLFCNVATSTPSPDPLSAHFATKFTSSPGISQDLAIRQGPLDIAPEILAAGDRSSLEEAATECYEWLSMIRLESPRVEINDDIDSYLSRYSVPEAGEQGVTVRKLSWQGFMSSSWVRALLVDVLVQCPTDAWFSLSTSCFSKNIQGHSDEVVILRPPKAADRYLIWEVQS